MEVQNQVVEIRSLAPIQALSPIYSVQKRPWYKVYRAQCMVAFPMYSIKIVYVITFIAFKIYVNIEVYLVPMVGPQAIPLQYPQVILPEMIRHEQKPIPIANYSYNCIYCARCNLGISCRNHVSRHMESGLNKQEQFGINNKHN